LAPPSTLVRLRWLAFVGVAGISFAPIFVRLAAVSPSTAAFYRTFYALPILWLLRLRVRRADTRSTEDRLWALAAGVLFGGDLAVWHRSIEAVGAGLATVLGNMQVFFVALAAWALQGERPRPALFLALPPMFVGVVLSSGLGRADAYGTDPWRGVAYGVATALFYTAFLLVFRRANAGEGPVVGPWLDATAGAVVTIVVWGALDGGLDYAFTWPAHGWLLGLAVVPHVVSWQLIAGALPRMPAVETSVLLLAQPVLAVVWGTVLLRENLSPLQVAGVVLVMAGIAFVSLSAARRSDTMIRSRS
jgi:drug/metabolite transporter (DMT)-like permease